MLVSLLTLVAVLAPVLPSLSAQTTNFVGDQYKATQTVGVPPLLTLTSPQPLYNDTTAYYYNEPATTLESNTAHTAH